MDEIKSIEVETPQISNQIAKLNQDIKDFTNIKADLAIAEARKANMDIEDIDTFPYNYTYNWDNWENESESYDSSYENLD